ncbi:hypothetical protein SAMN05192532_102487 [Alteribacillus iranensis]|uniref:Uncharacterized protein n=1 Tax=Alteribacillus iranensis TaxID=930128 RepID=A0A1I2BT01_9BACI|nr:hypothetical protein SAMN05192532_102487 [Alteribacillus iranensis]
MVACSQRREVEKGGHHPSRCVPSEEESRARKSPFEPLRAHRGRIATKEVTIRTVACPQGRSREHGGHHPNRCVPTGEESRARRSSSEPLRAHRGGVASKEVIIRTVACPQGRSREHGGHHPSPSVPSREYHL